MVHLITIIGLVAGVGTNYLQNQQNDTAIKGNSSWMVAALKEQSAEIKDLQIKNAVLQEDFKCIKLNLNNAQGR